LFSLLIVSFLRFNVRIIHTFENLPFSRSTVGKLGMNKLQVELGEFLLSSTHSFFSLSFFLNIG